MVEWLGERSKNADLKSCIVSQTSLVYISIRDIAAVFRLLLAYASEHTAAAAQ